MKDEIGRLLKIHDELTDKKLLKTITKDEEKELEKVRNDIECYFDDPNHVRFYKDRIEKYQKILRQLKKIKEQIKEK